MISQTLHPARIGLLILAVALGSKTFAVAQDASPLRDVIQPLRQRNPEVALDKLGDLVDRPIAIEDLAYSGLPSVAAGIHRSIAQLSVDERYTLLERWTLPSADRNTVRTLSIPVPTDAPPKVFARTLGERPRDDSFPPAAVGPVNGLFCSGWLLVQAADELGRIGRLRVALEELAAADVDGATELLMLAALAGSRGNVDSVKTYLQSAIVADATGEFEEVTPRVITQAAIASAALGHPKLHAVSESFFEHMVARTGEGKSIGLRPFFRLAHATAAQVHRGKSPPEVLFQSRLRHWIPVSGRSAKEINRGQPAGVWLTHENHVLHLAGGTADQLLFQYPLQAPFEFVCETQEGGDVGTDGGLVYGGLQFQALGRKDMLTVWDADANRSVTRPSPFARHAEFPVFNRVSIDATGETIHFESNFHPVWFDGPSTQTSPWLGLRSDGTKRPVFRNLRFTGVPVIPHEVQLINGDELRGWQSNFFDESQPPFQDASTPTPNEPASAPDAPFDWQAQSGILIGSGQTDPAEQTNPGWLRYQRPMLDGDSIRYEFQHANDDCKIHPTLGRLAFLLEPTGVRVRWITTGELDWSGLPSDNAALEPLNRRGPRPLPLKENEWNAVEIKRLAGEVLVTLNDELIYQRDIDTDSDAQFGLYRPERSTETRVRNAVLTGDWPESLDDEFLKNPLTLIVVDRSAIQR